MEVWVAGILTMVSSTLAGESRMSLKSLLMNQVKRNMRSSRSHLPNRLIAYISRRRHCLTGVEEVPSIVNEKSAW